MALNPNRINKKRISNRYKMKWTTIARLNPNSIGADARICPVSKLSHYDKKGQVRMVDVTEKPATQRTALAEAFVKMRPATVKSLKRLKSPKGNPLEIARIAGITAAKRTSDMIPLCHPLSLTHIDVTAKLCQNGVEIASQATATGPTGVEMEALVAASAAALTIYDMCKALERGMQITNLRLVKKTGGKSGVYMRVRGRREK
jgi:cyclic pyranopterin phosphate synthase